MGNGSIVAAAIAVAVLATACGEGAAPIVEPGDGGADTAGADDGVSDDGAEATPVSERPCPPWDAPRDYDPPPEEQPEPDGALTDAAVTPDVPVEAPEGDGEAAPEAPPEPGVTPMEAAHRWAEAEAPEHYAGMWIDNEHGATVMAFTEDVEAYAAQVRERFGAGWWVVRGEHSEAELQQVQESVIARMGGGTVGGTPPGTIVGSGLRTDVQRVTVEVVGGDDAVLEQLSADLDHPGICFEVLAPPPAYDPDGPVRTLATLPEWRPDADHEGDGALEIAYDQATGQRAFEENVGEWGFAPPTAGNVAEDGVHAGVGTVDWDREVLVVWSGGRSGSCPEWVEDVRTVDGRIELSVSSPSQGACTADFNPYRAVLAVDRDLLPDADQLPVPVGDRPGIEAVPYPPELS